MRRRRKLISLYTGAGGMDYGFEAAGFTTGAAVEQDHDCCETLRANRRWPVFEKSIFDVSTRDLLAAAGARRTEIDLVIGGPPCQPFSKAGYWASGDSKRLADPRAGTLGAYMRVVEEALPHGFVLENVEGLAYKGKSEGLELVLSMIEDINRRTGARYEPTFKVLNAADYGVPQVRNRLFLVAGRDGRAFRFPDPTHAAPSDQGVLEGLERYRTAWDAIGDIEPDPSEELRVRGKWADLLPSIPEGQNYLWHTDRGGGRPLFGWRRRYWCFLLKLAKNRPSWTLQAQPGPATGPFHWDNRRLSIRELARIQTFPNDVIVGGGLGAARSQLGNAVPSLLGEVLAREVRVQLLGERRAYLPLKLLPERRHPNPPPHLLQPVPERFIVLEGEHSPHPGTGMGHRAAKHADRPVPDLRHSETTGLAASGRKLR